MNQLEQLRSMTVVVADTGDIDAIKAYQPEDATTNPSLILKAITLPGYRNLLEKVIIEARKERDPLLAAQEIAVVTIGAEILGIVPGKVSTEVDARLSYNTHATIEKARALIARYRALGIPADRVLIKIAATWQGIRAAEVLEKEGIHTNLTLLFSFAQAVACAEAGVYLISPFVGRIYDWYTKNKEQTTITSQTDPGVESVTKIYRYYKTHGYRTVVMGASFRNIGQIQALAGCDRLTISPDLLQALTEENVDLPRQLHPEITQKAAPEQAMSEEVFYWQHNQDAMAVEKLAEGIRKFACDQEKLETLLQEKL